MTAAPRPVRVAALRGLVIGLALLLGCSDDPVIEEPLDANGQPLPPVTITTTPSGVLQLDIPTYDGSGDVVEPDVVHVPGGWHGWDYWMAYEPYPHSNDYFENASIATSPDGITWGVPDGVVNPVVPRPTGDVVHNSDPDLVYVHQLDRMVLFYRAVTRTSNILEATSSTDGVHWSVPARVLEAPRHSLVSPSVVLAPGRRAKLFYVDAGSLGCDAKETTVGMRRWMGDLHDDDALVGAKWSAAVATDLNGPPGWMIWHVDVIWVDERSEYWAVFPAHRAYENCAKTDLFMARSRDAVHWEVLPDPVLKRGDVAWANSALYRASMEYDGTRRQFRVWFSALSTDGAWRIGHGAFPISDILSRFSGRPR